MNKGKGKRFDEGAQEAMMNELNGSAFFQPPTNPQTSKATSIQVDKTTKPQIEKYTTHLRPDTIKAIKRWALDHEMKDYEVAQDAFDTFFQAHAQDEQQV
jgi:hypothetical protein